MAPNKFKLYKYRLEGVDNVYIYTVDDIWVPNNAEVFAVGEFLLPQGFRVAKNSLGQRCLFDGLGSQGFIRVSNDHNLHIYSIHSVTTPLQKVS